MNLRSKGSVNLQFGAMDTYSKYKLMHGILESIDMIDEDLVHFIQVWNEGDFNERAILPQVLHEGESSQHLRMSSSFKEFYNAVAVEENNAKDSYKILVSTSLAEIGTYIVISLVNMKTSGMFTNDMIVFLMIYVWIVGILIFPIPVINSYNNAVPMSRNELFKYYLRLVGGSFTFEAFRDMFYQSSNVKSRMGNIRYKLDDYKNKLGELLENWDKITKQEYAV